MTGRPRFPTLVAWLLLSSIALRQDPSLAAPTATSSPESPFTFLGSVIVDGAERAKMSSIAFPSPSGDEWLVVENMSLPGGHVRAAARVDRELRGIEGFIIERKGTTSRSTTWKRTDSGYRIETKDTDESKVRNVSTQEPLVPMLFPVLALAIRRDARFSTPNTLSTFDPLPDAARGQTYIAPTFIEVSSSRSIISLRRDSTTYRLGVDARDRTVQSFEGSGNPARIERREPLRTDVEVDVIGARIRPLKANGSAWDLSFKSLPSMAWSALGSATGYPQLRFLAYIPHENRPDPFAIASFDGREFIRTEIIQGTFLACWRNSALQIPSSCSGTSKLRLDVWDADAAYHDWIGAWEIPVSALRSSSGLQTLTNGGQVQSLRMIVRTPSKEPWRHVVIHRVQAKVRPVNPSGAAWDGPGESINLESFVNEASPAALAAIAVALRPDPALRVAWQNQFLVGPVAHDSFEASVDFGAWLGGGRPGSGDGVTVTATDDDIEFDDPIGNVYIPVERFEPGDRKTLTVKGDETCGLAEVSIVYSAR